MKTRILILFLLLIQVFNTPVKAQESPGYFAKGISSDTNINNGTINSYKSGVGPIITENVAGQITTGTIFMNLPGNYSFNLNSPVSLLVTGDSDPTKNINGLASGNTISLNYSSNNQIQIYITKASLVPNTLTFQGLQVRPNYGNIMMFNISQFYFEGSSINGTTLNNIQLEQVSGKAVTFIGWANDTMVTRSWTPFHVQVFARDAYFNFAKVLTDTFFVLAMKSGTGQIFGTLSGWILAGETNAILPSVFYNVAELNILLSITAPNDLAFTAGEILFSSLQGDNPPDTTAPVTTDNSDGVVHDADVIVTLSCTDNLTGCAKTYYTVDGSIPTINSSFGNSLTFSENGIYILKYFSQDGVGNLETVKTATNQIKIQEATPAPSASPSAIPSPSPTPDPFASMSPSPTPSPTPAPTAAPEVKQLTPILDQVAQLVTESESISQPIIFSASDQEVLGAQEIQPDLIQQVFSFWQNAWVIIWNELASRVTKLLGI